ncbi:MAG: hypothetical protein OEP95_00550 [Myxococcales bacterium]|nr:hypothetical protein [Myxococcales bacterium]
MSALVRVLLSFTLFAAVSTPGRVHADAVIVTRAMAADTIAEFFVAADGVTLELEIGAADLEAFADLLPDALYEKLGREPRPHGERLADFMTRGMPLVPDAGSALAGRLVRMEPRTRTRRDPVSGEPLPEDGAEPEPVVFARLEYPFAEKPRTLGLAAPPQSSVGFVVYHEGVAVNDFRYLSPSQTLELDWDDPWYTQFQRRALRRRYFAPMSGFLYVEPYEVRKEIVARPLDLQQWVDLGLAGRETIPPEIQPELLREAAAFLKAHHPVEIDGASPEPELARIHFLERSLKTSRVIDPPEELDIHSALLGVIFVYPTDGLPERVTMTWDLWSDKLSRVPVAAVDQAGPLPSFLEPDWRVLEWQNFLKNPELPTLRVLEPPPSPLERAALPLQWLLLALLAGALFWARRGGRGPLAVALGIALLAAGAFWLGRGAALSEPRAREVVSGLLHNVYRAFDFRDESEIYDVLARSADGALLQQVYLETRSGLELQSQGGARAKVKDIELVELEASPGEGAGFVADAVWNVRGSVGHWGHIHERRNRYRAELRIAPVDAAWKLVGLELLEEERL